MTALDKEIIRAYADNNMNLLATGRSLYLHRNTIEYHIERVKKITGLNAKVFRDLMTLIERIEADDEQ